MNSVVGYSRHYPSGVIRIMAIVLLLFVPSLFCKAFCQCPTATTQGNDFWVMFLKNLYTDRDLSLTAAGKNNAVITVEIPRINWQTAVNLSAGSYVNIPIPSNLVNTETMSVALDCGIHVTSTADISLYSCNMRSMSSDMTTVLPTSALGTYYMSQDYTPIVSALIGIVAVDDSTNVYIPGIGVNINLMRGQTYQVSSSTTLSGVEVFSDKPIAMFQGNQCALVPVGSAACDHLYEQSIPVDYWGRDFIVVPSAGRRGGLGNADIVKITSSQGSCDITINGTIVANNLNRGATYETDVSYSSPIRIKTTKPCCVCLYLSGSRYGGDPGDPASVVIPPIEQGVCEVTFAAYNTTNITDHYTNIVTERRYVSGMTLDGNSIASQFAPLDTVYSYAQLPVLPGTHTLQSSNSNFVAHFYGLGRIDSYAYTAGMGLRNIREGLHINGQRTRTLHDTVRVCVSDTAKIEFTTNSEDTSVLWYLDGGLLNVSQLSFKHHFNGVGAHRITAITHGLCDTLWCDTLEGVIKVVSPGVDTVHIPVCENEVVNYNALTFKGPGIYQYSYPSRDVCDSIRVVVAYLRDTIRDTIYPEICAGASFRFFGISYYYQGVYTYQFRTPPDSCIHNLVIDLTVNDTLRDTIHPVICAGASFDTNGVSYHRQGLYTQHLRTPDSCFHNLVIDLTVKDTIRDTIRPVICAGASFDTNGVSYYQPGIYTQHLRYPDRCFYNFVIDLTVNDTVRDTVYDKICDKTSYYFAGNVITEPGIYIDSNSTIHGCDSITVLFLEKLYYFLPALMPNIDIEEICLGTEISRTDTSVETQGNTYRWVWGDGYTSTSHGGEGVSHTYSTPGTYNVRCEILAPNGCTDTSYFRVDVYEYARASFSWDPQGIVNMPAPDLLFHNLSQPHNPQYSTYLWQIFDDSTSSGTPIEFTDYEPEYHWHMFGDNGGSHLIRLIAFTAYTKTDGSQLVCIDTAESSIYITNGFLQFPNVVTPNNDGINDIFEIKNLIEGRGFTDTELYIYNSWGRKVYHKKNISTREDFWDPAANNDPSGTYYYHFSAKGYTGNIQRNGAVQVLR